MYYSTYLIYLLPALIISFIAQAVVSSTFSKYSKVLAMRGQTASQVARSILDSNGLQNVVVEHVSGKLTDHFDPKNNIVRLSDSVYGSSSVASIGVAAHEVGHAVQYSVGYMPIKLRGAILPVVNFGSNMAFPIAILGIIFSYEPLVWAGIILFSAVVLFQLCTLPVEFNASSRALKTIDQYAILSDQEQIGAKKVLSAAAMTYVAAVLVSLASLLRLLALTRNRR